MPSQRQVLQQKKRLYEYLFGYYDISYICKPLQVKLAHIAEGTSTAVRQPVSYETLLDMFKFYRHELDKAYVNFQQSGKTFADSYGRVYYDLAILLSKYDQYLKHLEREKIIDCNAAQRKEHRQREPEQTICPALNPKPDEKIGVADLSDMIESW